MPKADTIRLRVTTEEKAQFEAAAKLAGISLSAWLRKLADLNSAPAKPKAITRGRNAISDVASRSIKGLGHNSSACRVYGCLMCKARGVKNAKRGL